MITMKQMQAAAKWDTGMAKPESEPPVVGSATGSAWVSVKDKLPMESEQVIAHYRGVYHRRLVIFWTDAGGNPHFGFQNEPDGKGSQPATHWHSLPELP